MALSGSQKKLILVVLACACLSSSGAEAWSWSWSSGSGWGWGSDGSSSSSSGPGWRWSSSPGWGCWGWWGCGSDNSGSGSGSNSGWGWGSDGSGSSGSGSGTNPDGSTWSWNWDPRSGWRWSWGSSSSGSGSGSVSDTEGPREIVVGGSEGWTKGLDYKEWASKNAPFYIDDVLVFKYSKVAKRRNNVYLFQDPWSYMNCNLENGKKIGLTNKGSQESFKFTLKNMQPYFFASGEQEGDYCFNHDMKFTIFPFPRPYH